MIVDQSVGSVRYWHFVSVVRRDRKILSCIGSVACSRLFLPRQFR